MIARIGDNNFGRSRRRSRVRCQHTNVHECYSKHPYDLTDEQIARLQNTEFDWVCTEAEQEARGV